MLAEILAFFREHIQPVLSTLTVEYATFGFWYSLLSCLFYFIVLLTFFCLGRFCLRLLKTAVKEDAPDDAIFPPFLGIAACLLIGSIAGLQMFSQASEVARAIVAPHSAAIRFFNDDLKTLRR